MCVGVGCMLIPVYKFLSFLLLCMSVVVFFFVFCFFFVYNYVILCISFFIFLGKGLIPSVYFHVILVLFCIASSFLLSTCGVYVLLLL